VRLTAAEEGEEDGQGQRRAKFGVASFADAVELVVTMRRRAQ